MSLYANQDANVRKTWLLITVFFAVVIGIGYLFAQLYGDPSFLYIAVIFSVLMNVLSYWFSDKIVLKMSGAKPASREAQFNLYTVVENLAITAGLPMPKIYVIDDPAPNAFATGRDKEHAVVAVSTGLLKIMDRTELEGVIAHELSHIGNRDILLSTVIVVLVGFISILADWFTRAQLFGGHSSDREGNGNAVFMVLGIVLAILSPIIATLMQLAISRRRELLADSSGALLTRYPEGLARALEKIGAYAAPMHNAHNVTAHLYLSNPFGAKAAKGLSKLFMTHPPVEDRIRLLRGMNL